MTVQILQEWDSITKETGPKEDEFLSVEIRLDQALCLSKSLLLRAIRLYMIATVEECNQEVQRGIVKGEGSTGCSFTEWEGIQLRMRRDEQELRRWKSES